MRVRINNPSELDELIEFLRAAPNAIIERLSNHEVEVSLLGSYAADAMRMQLYLQLRAWEASRRAAGTRVEILNWRPRRSSQPAARRQRPLSTADEVGLMGLTQLPQAARWGSKGVRGLSSIPMSESDTSWRERAVLFDEAAERYDRARPGYPEALIDAILADAGEAPRVLDVGCGTGIATRALAARGARVLGVELNAGMAAVARRSGIPVEVCRFEEWDSAGRRFERVVCAQAWQWLDHDRAVAKAVAALEPCGRLCLAWNIGAYPDPLADALHSTYRRVLGEQATLTLGYAAQRPSEPTADFVPDLTDALRKRAPFRDVQVRSFPWTRTYTSGEWVAELDTHSDHLALDPPVRARLPAAVADTIDRAGGSFPMRFAALLVTARRR